MELLKLDACSGGGKVLIYIDSLGVAAPLPFDDLLAQRFLVRSATIEALTLHDAKLDFRHVQPPLSEA